MYATFISEYHGVYCKRYQRGSDTVLSEHSFGLAIDINKNDSVMTYYYDPEMKQYITGEFIVNKLYDSNKGYIIPYDENDPNCAINLQHPNYILYKNCFEPAGFKWGMEFDNRYDGMHFEVETLYGE